MLTAYIDETMRRATYKILEDGTYYGEMAGFPGVWASEATLEECRRVLQEVLEEWLLLKLRPISRRELIRKFRALGFEGPISGGRHGFRECGQARRLWRSAAAFSKRCWKSGCC